MKNLKTSLKTKSLDSVLWSEQVKRNESFKLTDLKISNELERNEERTKDE